MSNSNLEQAVIDLMYLQVDEAIQESDIVSQHQYDMINFKVILKNLEMIMMTY
tara:strand:- start:28 stop:186 length:159 start_codon:yes stop_codon:yes gene_type:complete